MLSTVYDLCRREGTVPFDVEGDSRANGEDAGDRRSGNSQSLRQRVGEIVVVEEVEIRHAEACLCAVEVNLHGVVPYGNHPKYVVPVDVDVVVVDLFSELSRSNRTGEEVKSNKGERAFMLMAVGGDEFSLTEPHIRLECQPCGDARRGVCSGPAATDVR